MRILSLLVVFAAGSLFSATIPPGITVTVTPTLGPDNLTSANFSAWSTNVVTGLSTGTTPGSGLTAYVPIANGTVLNGNEFVITPFSSWQGVTPGLYPSEQGTVLYFSLKVLAQGGASFTLNSLTAQETYAGIAQPFLGAGSFVGGPGVFDGIRRLGLRAAGGFTDATDTSATALTALYYVGVGFGLELDPLATGTNQQKIDATVLNLQNLTTKTTSVCYTVTSNSNSSVGGCGNVGIANVPEPGMMVLLGAGLAGLAFVRRRLA